MFETIIIALILEYFLEFDELKNMCYINKYIRNMFLTSLYKRTMWKRDHLPTDLKFVYRLEITWDDFTYLPYYPNIKELKMIYHYWSAVHMNYFPNKFPPSLTSLDLGHRFHATIDVLPPNLIHLKFGSSCKVELGGGILPETLLELIFGDFVEINLEKCIFPSNLQVIEFGLGFFGNLNHIPMHIQTIRLNRHFEGIIPQHLQAKVKFVCYEDYQYEKWALTLD